MGSPLNPQSPIAISGLPLLGVSSQTDFRPRRPARRGLFLSETTHVRAPYAQSQRHRASALHAEGRKRPILADECNDCFSRQWNGSARRPGSPNRRAHRRSPPGRRGTLDTRLRGAGAAMMAPHGPFYFADGTSSATVAPLKHCIEWIYCRSATRRLLQFLIQAMLQRHTLPELWHRQIFLLLRSCG